MRAGVRKETGRWKSQWKIRDLLADGRCGQAVMDFLSFTDVGGLVPAVEEGGDAGSDVSEWELRERREREERRTEELGEEEALFLPTPSFMASAEEE